MPLTPREFRFLRHDFNEPLRTASSFLDLLLMPNHFQLTGPMRQHLKEAKASAQRAGDVAGKLSEIANRETMLKGNESQAVDGAKKWQEHWMEFIAHEKKMHEHVQAAFGLHQRAPNEDADWNDFMERVRHGSTLVHTYVDSVNHRKRRSFTLKQLIQDSLPQLEQTKLSIQTQLPKRDLVLKGNSVELQRILVNLATNAGVRGKAKTLRITALPHTDWLVLRVHNDGRPIPKDVQSRLFQEGFSTAGSSGLGLTLSREAAQRHGGNLRFMGSTEKGTTFELHLPIGRLKPRIANIRHRPRKGPIRPNQAARLLR